MFVHKGVVNSEPMTDLEDLPDGAGCPEIWEHLGEQRDSD